ncbi:MAG: ornithine cyclodeaminase family protein [Bacteroidota bacterium]
MDEIVQISGDFIEKNTNYQELIAKLKYGFASADVIVPQRHHHDFPNPKTGKDSTMLLMPAWYSGQDAGVKVVSVSPENHQFDLPAVQGSYIYMDAITGTVKAILEAKSLTTKRTAAASALASSFLSLKDAASLLMIGTGALSTNLIKAHAAVRPITEVFVWGRNFEKAKAITRELNGEAFRVSAIETIEEKISEVAIISCATLAYEPLVLGQYLKPGQHIDLVGAYKKDMREADDDTIRKTSVFLDSYAGGLIESGDIVIPIQKGILSKEAIKADLFELCSGKQNGRTSEEEITLFKSVGHALEDLVAAQYYFQNYQNA